MARAECAGAWQRVAEGGVGLVLGALVHGSGRLSAGARCTGAWQREA